MIWGSRGRAAEKDWEPGRLAPFSLERRLLVLVILAIFVAQPTVHALRGPKTATTWFEVFGAAALIAIVAWQLLNTDLSTFTGRRAPWIVLVLMLALAVSLFAVGGANWLAALAIAGALFARWSPSPGPAVAAASVCAVTGLVVSSIDHAAVGEVFAAIVVAPLAALFAYSSARQVEATQLLRRTRAELARAAATEERLRIARDMHDLIGHSLSLITLKAELAGRLLTGDPGRAAKEISELESVARQSLADVREALAGLRQPDLAGELAAAQQLLDAAGIASRITAPDEPHLGQAADAVLAWAVREGTTNVVRHSRATQVAITVSTGPQLAVAEITDNGPPGEMLGPGTGRELAAGPARRHQVTRQARPVFAGSGLAGLAERVRDLGGELAAGAIEPHGFRLRVVVPVGAGTT
jgi:two-component system, NarL family, sensor histidine kinase DesK